MIWPAKFSSNTHPFNFPTRGTCKLESCHPPTKAKDFPITLANRDYNALFPLETPVSFLQILPHPSPYPQRSRKKIKTKNKRKQNNKKKKKKDKQTNTHAQGYYNMNTEQMVALSCLIGVGIWGEKWEEES